MVSGTVKNCCGCFDLKTGCLIIGYLNLVTEIIFIIIGLTGLITGGVVAATSDDARKKDMGAGLVGASVFLVLVLIFSLAFTVVLLIGVHKNRRSYLKVYLIVSVILLILSALVSLVQVASMFEVGDFVGKIIAFVLSIYFLIVIRSYYYEIENEPPVYNKA